MGFLEGSVAGPGSDEAIIMARPSDVAEPPYTSFKDESGQYGFLRWVVGVI